MSRVGQDIGTIPRYVGGRTVPHIGATAGVSMILTVILGFVAVLIAAAAVTDFRARRRRIRLHGVEGEPAREARRLTEAELRLRSNYNNPYDPNSGF